MADNVFDEIEQAVTFLASQLQNSTTQDALGALPDFAREPIIEGLDDVLQTIEEGLQELLDQLDEVTQLEDIFATINLLMNAAQGLAPDQTERLETVRNLARTLEEIPEAERIGDIIGNIETIRNSLEQIQA